MDPDGHFIRFELDQLIIPDEVEGIVGPCELDLQSLQIDHAEG